MRTWVYNPSPNLTRSLSETLQTFPRERDITLNLLRTFNIGCIKILFKTYFRLEVIGRENIPQDKSYILVANHSSHLDALSLMSAIPLRKIHQTFPVAARDYFFCSFIRSFLSTAVINAMPFDRHHNKKESLDLCDEILTTPARALILFPEGTRSGNGKIQPFKKGIGILTAGQDRLVVPSFIDGAYQAMPKGRCFPFPKRISVIIGKPISFKNVSASEEGYRIVAQKTEDTVRQLQNCFKKGEIK